MSETHLVGIVASLRAGSVNRSAAQAAVSLLGDTATLGVHPIDDLPLYDGDAEEAGPPAPVTALYDAVRQADGIVLFSPEYNSSLPAVTKNVIDWLSRDPSCWDGTGITMVSMSPGGRAAAGAREHFEAIMPRQATRLFPTIGFGNYSDRLDENGEVVDPETLDELRSFLTEFAEFCLTSPG
jgi:NAD(P)H-dependent FMN reductase